MTQPEHPSQVLAYACEHLADAVALRPHIETAPGRARFMAAAILDVTERATQAVQDAWLADIAAGVHTEAEAVTALGFSPFETNPGLASARATVAAMYDNPQA